MIIKLDVSKLELATIKRIAQETDDVVVLEQLAKSDYESVAIAVINNPMTTQHIRENVYDNWQDKKNNKWVLEALVESPLGNKTISKMIDKEGAKSAFICEKLVSQDDISVKNLECIYNGVTDGHLSKELVETVLRVMAQRKDLSEELANKLLNYSSGIASIIAVTYGKFLRVDFSKG